MNGGLRLERDRILEIEAGLLDSDRGCGLVLAETPRYRSGGVFQATMSAYGLANVFVDKVADRILEEREDSMGKFCKQAWDLKMGLKQNFRTAFGNCGIYLALDPARQAAHFLAAAENRLALANYCRDALPAKVRDLGIAVAGSTARLTPVGWQSLFDLASDPDFRKLCPPVARIQVMGVGDAVRWCRPELDIGACLLNFSDARAICRGAAVEIRSEIAGTLSLAEAVAIESRMAERNSGSSQRKARARKGTRARAKRGGAKV